MKSFIIKITGCCSYEVTDRERFIQQGMNPWFFTFRARDDVSTTHLLI